MFGVEEKEVKEGVIKFRITKNGIFFSYRDWIDHLKESTEFIRFHTSILRKSPYEGYYWEVKPVNKNNLEQAFEFVLVESESLPNIIANDMDFKKYFKEDKEDFISSWGAFLFWFGEQECLNYSVIRNWLIFLKSIKCYPGNS